MITLLASFLALLETSATLHCDMGPEARPDDLVGYHALAETCLLFPPEEVRFAEEIEADLVAHINRERRAAGLAPLLYRPELRGAARFHSLDLAANGRFDHAGTAGRSPFERIAALDRTLIAAGAWENVSRVGGDVAPGEVTRWIHDGLMQSDGHRANILAAEATHVAVGVVAIGKTVYTTQLFVAEVASLPAPLPVELVDPAALHPLSLPGWTFAAYTVAYDDGTRVRLPGAVDLPGGEGRLLVEARRADPGDPQLYNIINYTGPAVVVP